MWIELEEWESYKILGVQILGGQYRGYKRSFCKLMDMKNRTFCVWTDPWIIEMILQNVKVKETNDCVWILRWGIHKAFVETMPDDDGCGFDPVIMEKA